VAREIKAQGLPMVMNVVIHRHNIDHIDRIIAMAVELGAEYLELANTQYYSWAYLNREQLLPTHEQLRRAEAVTVAWRERLGERMRLFFVAPDYHEGVAKKCVNGWGSTFITVAPDGVALPCHTARMLPGLEFPNVRAHGMREIWFDSEGFNRYRRSDWMKEPCVSCDQREVDLGGCRCQAFLIANDPAAADPVCHKSPHRAQVQALLDRSHSAAGVREQPIVFRDHAASLRLSAGVAAPTPSG
jgi:pyrroloquinoline quinone biosynthesis protein E